MLSIIFAKLKPNIHFAKYPVMFQRFHYINAYQICNIAISPTLKFLPKACQEVNQTLHLFVVLL